MSHKSVKSNAKFLLIIRFKKKCVVHNYMRSSASINV